MEYTPEQILTVMRHLQPPKEDFNPAVKEHIASHMIYTLQDENARLRARIAELEREKKPNCQAGSVMKIKPEWIKAAIEAVNANAHLSNRHSGQVAIEAVAPLIVAEVRAAAFDEAAKLCTELAAKLGMGEWVAQAHSVAIQLEVDILHLAAQARATATPTPPETGDGRNTSDRFFQRGRSELIWEYTNGSAKPVLECKKDADIKDILRRLNSSTNKENK